MLNYVCFNPETSNNSLSTRFRHCCRHYKTFWATVPHRFENNTSHIVTAFAVFNPNNFPQGHADEEQYEKQLKGYGTNEMGVLSDWYGTGKEKASKQYR